MIFNANNKKTRTPTSPTVQPPSEIRKKEISDRLKTVDKLIKDGNLDEAGVLLEAVRAMDPKNGYILALGERIEELRKARDNPQTVESPKAGEDSSAGIEIERRFETELFKRLTEEVKKVEERLEAEYRNRFMEEVSKGEQRITELLKEVDERHNAERAALIENIDKEKEELLTELKNEVKKLFDVEFKKADDSYRKLLADKIRKTEEHVSVEISALYEKAVVDLKEAMTKERTELLDAERKAIIVELKKQTAYELPSHSVEEAANGKTALTSPKEEHKEEDKTRFQTVPERKSEADLKPIGRQEEAQSSEPEKATHEEHRTPMQEIREALDKSLPETKLNDPKSETEAKSKPAEIQKGGEADLGIKSEEQLAQERELRDKLREMEFRNIRDNVNWKDRPRKKKR